MQKLQDAVSSGTPGRPLRLSSGQDPANRGLVRFKKVASMVCQWIAERGNLPHTLTKDECPWLLLTPQSLAKEFEKAELGHQVVAAPQQVRDWYQTLAKRANFDQGKLEAVPFQGLQHGGIEAVVGVLRCCISDVAPHEAAGLLGLPVIPTSDGRLITTGSTAVGNVLVTADVATVGFLTGGAAVCAHPLATPLLKPFARNADSAAQLCIRELNPAVMAELIRTSIPALCTKKGVVQWDASVGTPVSEAWVRMLFHWLEKQKTKVEVYSTSFTGIAILPTFTTKPGVHTYKSLLLAQELADCVLRRPLVSATDAAAGSNGGGGGGGGANDGNAATLPALTAGEAQAMGASHTRVLDLLVRIGVPVLQDEYEVPDACGVRTFAPQAAVEVLSRILKLSKQQKEFPLKLDFSWLKAPDVNALLKYFAAAGLAQDHLELLRSFPIFEVATPKAGEPRFVPIEGVHNVRLLPLFAPSVELDSGCFLKAKPGCEHLYQSLGIVPLLQNELYTNHIFPRFPTMTNDARLEAMTEVRMALPQLYAENKAFETVLRELAWVQVSTRSAHLYKCHELFDRSEMVFRDFFPDRVPPSTMASWVPFMLELGLQKKISRELALQCANRAAEQQDPVKGRYIIRHVVEQLEELCAGDEAEVNRFLDTFSALPLVAGYEVHVFGPPLTSVEQQARTEPLLPLNQVALKEDWLLCWTVRPVMAESVVVGYLTIAQRAAVTERLRIQPVQLPTMLDHLTTMCSLAERTPPTTASQRFTLKKAIGLCYEIIAQKVDSNPDMIRAALADKKCLLLDDAFAARDKLVFVSPSMLYFELDYVLTGFAYQFSLVDSSLSQLYAWRKVAGLLGVKQRPALADLTAMLVQVNGNSAQGRPLDADGVELVINVLKSIPDDTSPVLLGDVLAPDAHGRLAPINRLVLNDASWLQSRIDSTKLAIAHPRLAKIPVVSAGIELLSKAVREVLMPGFTPVAAPPNPKVDRWSNTLSSAWFREGLRRILGDRPGDTIQHADKLRAARMSVFQLANLRLSAVQELRSRFVLVRTGEDITIEAAGSKGLVDGAVIRFSDPFVCS
jgi:hypothetical protein